MLEVLAMSGVQGLYSTNLYQHILDFDSAILFYVQNHIRSDLLTPVFKVITHTTDGGAIWLILTAILLLIPKTRKLGLCSVLSMLMSLVMCNLILKNLFARTRPYLVFDGLELLVKPAKDYSFPSGHTCFAISTSAAIFFASEGKARLITVWAVVFALLVGFSRIYVGIHYPTDVLGAALVAFGFAYLGAFLGKKLYAYLAELFRKAKEKRGTSE